MGEEYSNVRRVAALSNFQITALMLAILVSLAGVGGLVWQWMDRKDDQQQVAAMPDDVRTAVQDTPADPSVHVSEVESWNQWLSTRGVKIGLSFLGAFAIGYLFRTFLKTMAILTAMAVTALLLLSYFNVYNVDFTAVQEKWETNREWVTTQATKLKDVVWTYLPSSTVAFVGFFVGMLRR